MYSPKEQYLRFLVVVGDNLNLDESWVLFNRSMKSLPTEGRYNAIERVAWHYDVLRHALVQI